MRWYRRRQERRNTVRAARLLLAVDKLAAGRGLRKPRAAARASLGPAR
jgi:hypothetical protein